MATTGNGKHEPLQTGLKEEQVMENSAEGRLEATIKIKIGVHPQQVLLGW